MIHVIRTACRRLARAPGFVVTVTATLAVGIGASTLIFSVINDVLLKPLPYANAGRIVDVRQVNDRGQRGRVSDPNFNDLKAQTRSLERFAQYAAYEAAVAGGDEPVLTVRADVASEFFDIFQVRPSLGRIFVPEEQRFGGAPAAMVSYAFWQRYLGGAQDLSSRSLRIGGAVFSIVGVMPRGFDFPEGAAIWTPRELWPELGRGAHNFSAVGLLAPNVSVEAADAEFSAVARRLKAQYGDDTFMVDADVETLRERLVGPVRPALTLLAAAAALLFAIAVANTTNLMFARALMRERDVAVRLALGARRRSLAVDFFADALLLSLAGAIVGFLIAWIGSRVVSTLGAGLLPRASSIDVDVSTALMALGLVLVAAVTSGLFLAWRAPNDASELQSARRATVRRHSALLRDGLVAVQVAIALVLAIGASLLGRSYFEVASVDPGFQPEGMLFVNVTSRYSRDERPQIRDFHARVLERLQAMPGASTGAVSSLPSRGGGTNGSYIVLERPDEGRTWPEIEALARLPGRAGYAEYRVASEGYFEALGVPVLLGRPFEAADGPGRPHVAVVSRSLAEAQWPGEDPLGKLIQFGGMDGDLAPLTVVGVVGDVRDYGLDQNVRPTVYVSFRQRPAYADSMWFAVRVPAPESSVALVRDMVRDIDPDVPTAFVLSSRLYADTITDRRFYLTMLAVFGGSALVLAIGGLYAAVAFGVAQRTHEIGVRIALGATVARVVSSVVGRSLSIAGLGLAAGFAISLGASSAVAPLLYGIAPQDPPSYFVAAVVLLATALGAAAVPALRAARIDPATTLRDE